MTVLSAKERGDMAEELLPIAANLVTLVHGDGGPRDVHQALARLSPGEKEALLVVLAGLVDPDQPLSKALGWLDFNEHGQTVVPAWTASDTLRDLTPEPELEDDDLFIDEVAVKQYAAGQTVRVSHRERLAAVVWCVNIRGMSYPDIDRMHGLREGSTATFISRLRKKFTERGEEFPEIRRPDAGTPVLTDEQVVEIRERYAAGGVSDLDLAISYDVTRNTISSLLTGESYAKAGGPIRQKRANRLGESSRVVWGGCKPGFGTDIDNEKTKEIAA